MGVVDDEIRHMGAAAARVAMGRLVRLYLARAGDGAELPRWQRAVAGATGRTVPRGHVGEAFDEIKVLRSRFLAGEAEWTAGEWLVAAGRALDRECPQRHRAAAYEMARRMITGVMRAMRQPVVTSHVVADLYGAVHGLAAGLAVFISARAEDQRGVLEALPELGSRFGDPDALSVYLRDEWRRRVDELRSWQAAHEHEYMSVPDDAWTDLDAVLDDLRLVAPTSPETAPRDWPGGWVLHRDSTQVFGPGGQVAWVSEADAREAAAALASPVDVVWSPFAADVGGMIVLDRRVWAAPADWPGLGV